MFENLKAFIRHGKQANELKKKPVVIGLPVLINVEGTTFTGHGTNDELHAKFEQQELEISNLPSTINNNNTIHEENYQPEFTITDANAQTNNLEDLNLTGGAGNYETAATQIVEQENIQRQKGKAYLQLENYTILEQMGEGAFSVVYKAQHKQTLKFVAIKILRKFQMDQAQKQSVLKEITIMRQLNHPNIVKFIEFIDSDQYYYIVQELAIGGEIFTQIVKYTYLSENLARHVIIQVALAIKYLHEEVGIVHRDIKPENILFNPIEFISSQNPSSKLRKSDDPSTKEDEGEYQTGIGGGSIGQVKLADFGLSKQIWEHNTKTPCGTVGYTAPEIVRDEKYSKEVDMWAIGCVLYTLLCGFPPFYDERIETLTEKVARGEYKFLTPWWDEISILAKSCVKKLLTVDPMKRYTIDDFLNDPWVNETGELEELLKQSEGIVEQTISQPQVHSQPQPIPNGIPIKAGHPINNEIASSTNISFSSISKTANVPRYSKKFKNSELYSPAAVALRDAFDISAAVHRMGEEAALSNRFGNVVEVIEEDEDLEEDFSEQVALTSNIPKKTATGGLTNNVGGNLFDLNLGGASIIERRKHKHVPIP